MRTEAPLSAAKQKEGNFAKSKGIKMYKAMLLILVMVPLTLFGQIPDGKKILDKAKKKNKEESKKEVKDKSKKSDDPSKSTATEKKAGEIPQIQQGSTAAKENSESKKSTHDDYQKLTVSADSDPFEVKTLKTYIVRMLECLTEVETDNSKEDQNIADHVFSKFEIHHSRAQESLTTVRTGKLLANADVYESAMREIKQDFEEAKKTFNEKSRFISVQSKIRRMVSDVQDQVASLKQRSNYDSYMTSQAKDDLDEARTALQNAIKEWPQLSTSSYAADLLQYEKELQAIESSGNASEDFKKLIDKAYFEGKFLLQNGLQYGAFTKDAVQSFYENCAKINYPKALSALNNTKQSNDVNPSQIEYLTKEFPTEFNAYLKKGYIADINSHIEKAYAYKANGKTQLSLALEEAETAVIMADAVLLVKPDDVSIQRLRKDALSTVEKMKSEIDAAEATAFTSTFHKENKSKIVFSKSRISIKQENASTASEFFNGGEPIYAMAYFTGMVKDLPKMYRTANPTVRIKYYVDVPADDAYAAPMATVEYQIMASNKTLMDATILEVEVAPNAGQTDRPEVGAQAAKMLSQLSPRLHSIRVVLSIDNENFATGSFELDGSQGLEKFAALGDDLIKSKIQNARPPKGGVLEKTIEQGIRSALKSEGFNVLRVIQTDPQWYYERHPITGAILNRTIQAAIIYKDEQNKCIVEYMEFTQKYINGQYDALYRSMRGTVTKPYEVLSEHVNG